ncbi:hypothetical protein [Bathymodiolus platifrons methanotrophic gill symbiont]|uniref:hypothetical protein n=1 Tax=Bathymodiolus platifrons methanotrophic gill symbiont TaxID=113268 RepID=UPI0011250677|nr:hypothetical protein [Bathymodiolus platifrons methanotrophic gill symbiont]
MKKLIITTFIVVLIQGCTSTRISRDLSSGAIGCPAQEIKISNETAHINTHNWVASCRGKIFICSYVSGGSANCKEELK